MKLKSLFCCISLFAVWFTAVAENAVAARDIVGFDNMSKTDSPKSLILNNEAISSLKAFRRVEQLPARKVRLRQSPVSDLGAYTGERSILGQVKSTGFMRVDTVTVEKVSATQLQIKNFFFPEATVQATVDLSTGRISILPQHVFDTADGAISLCSMDFDSGLYSETTPIEGYLEDGNIFLESGLGFFVTSGSRKGSSLNLGLLDYTYMVNANGTLDNKIIEYAEGAFNKDNRVIKDENDWVFVHQIADDAIRISHIPLSGVYVDMEVRMNFDNTLSINPQTLYDTSSTGAMYCYEMEETEGESGSIVITTNVLNPIPAAISQNEGKQVISVGKWMAANSVSGKFAELFESSVFSTSAEISFPQKPSANFEGEGTKESPYLIKTAADLNALSIAANTDTSVRGQAVTTGSGSSASSYYPVYQGKYFKLDADIDMKPYKMSVSPIGGSNIRFAGTFDGGNHTISNFHIDEYAYDYCALFGAIDGAGVVKNVKFVAPRISSLGYMVATVTGANFGQIDNCHVENGKVLAEDGNSIGGIAGTSAGVISNCSFLDGTVRSLGNVGGIVGTAYDDVLNCHVDATVSLAGSQVFIGGVVGLANGQYLKKTIKIADCSFSGSLSTYSANMGMGGIAGYIIEGELARCFTVGNLSATSRTNNYLGGVVGTVYKSQVHDCYSAGRISNPNTTKVGGILGQSSGESDDTGTTVTNCYTTMWVSSMSTEPARAMVGQINNITLTNCWYDSQIMPVRHENGVLTSELASASGFKGFDSGVWVFADKMYPRLKSNSGSDAALVSASPLILAATDSINMVRSDFSYTQRDGVVWQAYRNGSLSAEGGNTFDFNNGVAKLNGGVNTDTVCVSKGNVVKVYNLNVAPILFKGDGTAESPWQIGTKEELQQFSDLTNNAKLTFEGKYLKLTSNIDMEGEWFTPICKDDMGDFRFEGTFDGAGFTIDNLFIQTIGYYPEGHEKAGQVNPTDKNSYWNNGLFGLLGEKGTIRNVTIGSGSHYDMFCQAGSIVGRSYGLVENCKNYATVKACYGPVGGIAGELQGNAIVRNCHNAGNVYSGFHRAGGIVGGISTGTASVENCSNVAEVGSVFLNEYQKDGTQEVAGGIVGENRGGSITNVFNSGNVVSYKSVGGIAGTNSGNIKNALNVGYVVSRADKASAGAIAGTNSGSFESAYYDSQLLTVGAANGTEAGGVSALPTKSMVAGNLALSDSWQQEEGSYPVLKLSATEEPVRLASMAVVEFSEGENVLFVSKPATLGNANEVVYSLKKGEYFKIEGSTLTVTPPVSGVAQDTVVAKIGKSLRVFPLQTLNADIFDGDGTAESPFLIKSADDLLSLSAFIKNTGFSYQGMYFKVTDNLDFAGKAFEPVAVGATTFNGIFDGNGKNISNIAYDATQTTNQNGAGLFGTVGDKGKVSNLTIDETNSFKAKNTCGAVAGYLFGVIENVTNKASVEVSVRYAGGIAGTLSGNAYVVNSSNYGKVVADDYYAGGIFSCNDKGSAVAIAGNHNFGAVEGKENVGGIAGYASAHFDDCHNEGDVTATNDATGGIVGYAAYPSSVKNSDNKGKIAADDYFGGIVGMTDDHSDEQRFIVENCNNSGEIAPSKKKPTGECGGIGGEIGSGSLINNCHNTGTIAVAAIDYSLRWAGGIIGRASGSDGAKVEIVDCSNTADISGLNSIGGVSGYLTGGSNAIIRNCYNTGNINATHKTLGNIGGLNGNGGCLIVDSWNSGKVTAIADVIGGIAGSFSGGEIQRCFNVGNVVTSTSEGKSVGGFVGEGNATITDSYNFGDVEGYDNVGGITGKGGSSVISRVYNAGHVKATDGTNTGNLCPQNSSDKMTVESAYFDSSVSQATDYDSQIAGLQGLPTKDLCNLDLGESFSKAVATYPLLKAQSENAVNSFYVATLLLTDGDNLDDVKNDFQIGVPNGVVWSSTPNLEIEGNKVIVKNSAIGEKAELTINAGELSRSYQFTLNKKVAGVEDGVADGKSVVGRMFYSIDGKEIAEPSHVDGIVIEKTIFDDGSVEIRKIIGDKH